MQRTTRAVNHLRQVGTPEKKDRGSTLSIFALASMPEGALHSFPLPSSSSAPIVEAEPEKTQLLEAGSCSPFLQRSEAEQMEKGEEHSLKASTSPSIFDLASLPEESLGFFPLPGSSSEAEEKAAAQKAGLTEAGFFLQKTELGAMRKHYSESSSSVQAVDQAEGQRAKDDFPTLWAVANGGEDQLEGYFQANPSFREAQQKAKLREAGFFLAAREHPAARAPLQAGEGAAQEEGSSSGDRSSTSIQTAIMWAGLDEHAGGLLGTPEEAWAALRRTEATAMKEKEMEGVVLTVDSFLNVKKDRPLSLAVPSAVAPLAPAVAEEEDEAEVVFESALPDAVAQEPSSAAQQLVEASMLLHLRHVQESPGQQQKAGMQAQPLAGRLASSSGSTNGRELMMKGEGDELRGLDLLRGASGGLGSKQLDAMRQRYAELGAQRRGEAKETFGSEARRSRI